MRSTFLLSTVLASLVLASSATAFAADEEGGEGSEEPKPKKKAKPAEPAPSPSSSSTSNSEKADHDVVVGKIGVGYLGAMPTKLGTGGNLTAQIIGMRYWFNPGMGLTAGLGFGSGSSSSSSGGTNVEGPSATVFAVKGGLPIALATSKHYTFVLEPQLAFGYATSSQSQNNTTIDLTGYRVAVGATAGAEIHFGFIGIPELSLVGSIGLAFDTQGGKTKTTAGGNTVENAVAQTTIATFTRENPWNIFSGNVAAIYYF